MDVTKWKDRLKLAMDKYKYAMLVLLVGLALMCLPSREKETVSIESVAQENQQQKMDLSRELSEILSAIKGAGEVRVLLAEGKGEQILYQTDNTISQDSSRTETILITDSNRNQSGLIHQKNPPVYQGAIVLAQGADIPSVKLALTEAVSKVTGLGADRISVLKMK